MAVQVAWKRVAFWGGLACIIYAAQGMGVLDKDTKLSGFSKENNVVMIATGDTKIEVARADARAALPRFLEAAAEKPADWENVTLKVAFEGATMIENIWVSDFHPTEGENFEAVLANEPVDLPGLHAGDRVTFHYSQIGDWAFIQSGKGYGFYSVRAMKDQMSEEQIAAVDEFLSADPLPSGW